MGFVWSAAKKDLARWRQDWAAFLLWLAIPLLIGGLMMVLFSGGSAQPRGLLLVTDQDDSLLSGFLTAIYSQGELGEMLQVETVPIEDGGRRMEEGDASGHLLIPAGFQDAMLGGTPVSVQLTTNPSQTILPGIITDVTEILLDAGFYLDQLLGSEIQTIQNIPDSQSISDVQVAEIAVAIQGRIEAAAPILFPPLIDLSVKDPPPSKPEVSIAILYLPGIVLMALLFAALGLATDLWKERDLGTLRRLVATPGGLHGFLAGKALAAAAVLALIGLVTLTLGFLYNGIPMLRLPVSLAWVTLGGVALFSWLMFLQMLAPSRHSAELTTTLMVFPLLMLGGSFFPLDALPGWLAAMGEKTPNGYMVRELTKELTAEYIGAIAAEAWLLMTAVAASGLALSGWRLQSGFAAR